MGEGRRRPPPLTPEILLPCYRNCSFVCVFLIWATVTPVTLTRGAQPPNHHQPSRVTSLIENFLLWDSPASSGSVSFRGENTLFAWKGNTTDLRTSSEKMLYGIQMYSKTQTGSLEPNCQVLTGAVTITSGKKESISLLDEAPRPRGSKKPGALPSSTPVSPKDHIWEAHQGVIWKKSTFLKEKSRWNSWSKLLNQKDHDTLTQHSMTSLRHHWNNNVPDHLWCTEHWKHLETRSFSSTFFSKFTQVRGESLISHQAMLTPIPWHTGSRWLVGGGTHLFLHKVTYNCFQSVYTSTGVGVGGCPPVLGILAFSGLVLLLIWWGQKPSSRQFQFNVVGCLFAHQ